MQLIPHPWPKWKWLWMRPNKFKWTSNYTKGIFFHMDFTLWAQISNSHKILNPNNRPSNLNNFIWQSNSNHMLFHGPCSLHQKMDAHQHMRERSLTIPIPNTNKRISEYFFSLKLPISTQRKACKCLGLTQFRVVFAFDNFQFQAPWFESFSYGRP